MDERAGRRNLGCGGTDTLLERRFADGEERGAEQTAAFGELIPMGFGEFLDHAVGPQETQLPADACGASARLGSRQGTWRGMKELAEIAIAKPCRSKLAAADGLKQRQVRGVTDPARLDVYLGDVQVVRRGVEVSGRVAPRKSWRSPSSAPRLTCTPAVRSRTG